MHRPNYEDPNAEGCAEVCQQMMRWINCVTSRSFEALEDILADNFYFSCSPVKGVSLLNKRQFIELDTHIYNSTIVVHSLTAYRVEDIIISRLVATINEELRGDLGPDFPSAEEMIAGLGIGPLVYSSSWRQGGTEWQCYDHHFFGSAR